VKILDKFRRSILLAEDISSRLQRVQEALGRIESRQSARVRPNSLTSSEFRVFSQWGEDGIIQMLLREVQISRKIFIEFGVQDYRESNTRFLLVNNNWSGLIIDGSQANIAYVKNDPIYWQHNIKAECAFITRENVNDLFSRNGIVGEIGILSVDIDGNDYWVWQSIDVVRPAIVVIEYNARFGPTDSVTVPYDPSFVREKAHHSCIYYGASLTALYALARAKGYALVGCNSAGNNAFFVQDELLPQTFRALLPAEAYVPNQFREARDRDGTLAYLSREAEAQLLHSLPLVHIDR